jgi:hypothetical protein
MLAGTNLAYHFPTMFAILGVHSVRPLTWGNELLFVDALLDGEVMALTTHFLLASLAVTGALLMLLAHRQAIEHPHSNMAPRFVAYGARFALTPTLMQLLSGTLLVLQVADETRDRLLGGDLVSTSAFLAGVVLTVILMHKLSAIALGELNVAEVWLASLLMLGVILLMVAALQETRAITYEHLMMDRAEGNIREVITPLKDQPKRLPAVGQP